MPTRAKTVKNTYGTARGRRAAWVDWRWIVLLGGISALLVFAGQDATGTPPLGTEATAATGTSKGPAPDMDQARSQDQAVAVDLAVEVVDTGGQRAYVLVLGAMASGLDDAALTFRSGQAFDFVAVQDGREVWRWSAGRVFHQAVTKRRFRPRELVVFAHVWDGRDAAGNPLTGPVEIRAMLTSDPPVATEPVVLDLP
ncbi:MAG: hypothetical protein BAA04_07960 [Firmicutes bacterium ZCTH02-B6]|nr:MAG: hypothetical protein BAA04_07960 [Firmicutes bacterium ZCTH02-B6]